jgi:hypothetical protein
LVGRLAGLVVVVAAVVAGGTLLAGVAATALAGRASVVRVAVSSVAAILYAVAFAATVAPVALAALGARSRVGGYFALLFVLVVPELFKSWTTNVLPYGWQELTSIPAALAAFRSALTPDSVDVATALRAIVVLAAVSAIALAVVRTQIARVDSEAR